MVEKIRVSLWDLYTFLLSGFFLSGLIVGHLEFYDKFPLQELINHLLKMPAALLVFALPLAFILLGMLTEPIANYFDSFVLKRIWSLVFKRKVKHIEEKDILKEEIRSNYLGSLNGKIDDPFSICKEYVETKDLSTTFMVFLSRYGFYRNVAFLLFVFGILNFVKCNNWLDKFFVLTVFMFLVFLFKNRAEDFYSYMAPSVFRCFYLDRALSKSDSE